MAKYSHKAKSDGPRRDMSDDRPQHLKIAATLRARIMSGSLAPGAQLPSTAQLVEQFRSASATVQRALSVLKEEGFLVSRTGVGVYVRDRQQFVVDVAAYYEPSTRKVTYRMLSVDEVTPPTDVSREIGEERAILRHRMTLRETERDPEPVELSWSYYPASLAAGTPLAERGKIRGGAPKILKDLGHPEREFVDQLSVRAPTPEEAEMLDIPEGVPVLRQLRTVRSDDGRVVEVSVIIKPGHLYELKYHQTILAD